MKKFAMLILLGVFATASVSACSKDKKDEAGDKKDDKAGDKKDDKKGDTAAKGADTDKKKAEGDTAGDRKADKGTTAATDDKADEKAPEEAKDGDKAPAGDATFDDAFVKKSQEAFEGFIKVMEDNKDDCPKMAKELEAYMDKFGHIKKKVDAIEADPKQKEAWEAANAESDKALQARMMPALETCMQDPALEAVFKKMQ